MIDRIEDQAQGQEHFYGRSPAYEEFNWQGLPFSSAQFQSVTSIDKELWLDELKLHDTLFEQLGTRLPQALRETRQRIEKLLSAA
jgi:phosphoenolpyruvate carboxykinase (GTP)